MSNAEVSRERRGGVRGPEGSGGPTLRDVARAAGVSVSTASRALAPDSPSPAATRAAVAAAAESLGYVMNGLARSMMGVGKRSVAFISHAMVGPTFAAMAAGVEDVATAHGHLFMLSTSRGDEAREAKLIDALREQRAAAVLLVGASSSDASFTERLRGYAERLQKIDARLILCGRPEVPELPHVASVDYDHTGGVRTAVAHLAGLGHRRIAFVGHQPHMTSAEQRLEGYRLGLDDAGIEAQNDLVIACSNEIDAGAAAVRALFDADPSVTALVCHTDIVAVGAYRALRELNLAIPQQVSVIGFDDIPIVSDLTPALTTIRAPFHEVGTTAGRIAAGLSAYAAPITLPTELIIRQSTGAAPR